MSTDFVQLFDKRLCDRITSASITDLRAFMPELIGSGSLPDLRDREYVLSLLQTTSDDQQLAELKRELIMSSCFVSDILYVDYWACFAELFIVKPEGSISSVSFIPGAIEETFLLLNQHHVDTMLLALEEHRSELKVMTAESIGTLTRWRDQCVGDTGLFVAYVFD